MYYIEFVTNDVSNRGLFIPIEEYPRYLNMNFGSVMFKSYYMYDETAKEHVESTGSISGYDGNRYMDNIILDIDCEDDIQKAASTAMEITEFLSDYHEINPENIQVWFSGKKGFHIHLPNLFGYESGFNLPATHQNTIEHVFSRWHDTLDTKPLQKSGLIRCPWSLHSSTGHIKVPLHYSQLSEFSKNPDADTSFATKEHYKKQFDAITESMNNENDGDLHHLIVETDVQQNHLQSNEMDQPNSMVTCMQKLLLRGPESGRRHQDSLRLVSNWRRQGIPESYAFTLLERWLDDSGSEDFRRIVTDVYKQGYAYSCRDDVMAEFCDSQCIFYKNKNYAIEVESGSAMQSQYLDYLNKIDDVFIDLVKPLGLPGTYKILPGNMAIFTGDTGAGKTAFVQDFLTYHKLRTLYFNLEMHPGLIYRRFLQRDLHTSKENINQMMRNGYDFTSRLQWIDFLHESPRLEDIPRIVSDKDYKVIVIDTSDGIEVPANTNEYKALGDIIKTMMSIAQNQDVIVILVHHLKKRGGRKSISLDDLLGNRSNVTKMDHVFAIEGGESYKLLRSLKTRDDSPVELHLSFEYETFKFEVNDRYEQQYQTDLN